jgi:hypothetical protein
MRYVRPLLAGTIALASFAGVNAAEAGCYGSSPQLLVCATVDPGALPQVNPRGSTINGCITVDSVCVAPYKVPVPTTGPGNGGPILSVTCYGTNLRCTRIEI